MKLVEENYFSEEAEKFYTGSSQIKAFMKCEAKELSKINGTWKDEPSKALLVGSYVDAAVSETLDVFKAQHRFIAGKDFFHLIQRKRSAGKNFAKGVYGCFRLLLFQ